MTEAPHQVLRKSCDHSLVHDLNTLISCIKNGDRINSSRVQEALKAIIIMCSNMKCAKDVFRETGALKFLSHFVYSATNVAFMEYGYKALACAIDQNAENQQALTVKDTFMLIKSTLTTKAITPSLLSSTAFFTTLLLYQNAEAQSLLNDSGCLDVYINLYEHVFPPSLLGHVSVKNENAGIRIFSIEVWQLVNSVMCFAMNNPVNELNQNKAAELFPIAFQILRCSSYCEVVSSVSSFLSSLITENVKNQDLLLKYSGPEVLKNCLEVGFMSIAASADRVQTVPEQDLQATISVIGVVDVAVIDHEENADCFGDMGIVTLISKFLFANFLDNTNKVKVLFTLSHLAEFSERNAYRIMKEDGLLSFLESESKSKNDDVLKTCHYFIHLLLLKGESMKNSAWKLNESEFVQVSSAPKSPSCITEGLAQGEGAGFTESEASSMESVSSEKERIALQNTRKERVLRYLKEMKMYCKDEGSPVKEVSEECGAENAVNSQKANSLFFRPHRISVPQCLADDIRNMTKNFCKQVPVTPVPKLNSEFSFSGFAKKIGEQSVPSSVASSVHGKRGTEGERDGLLKKRCQHVFTDKLISSIVDRMYSSPNFHSLWKKNKTHTIFSGASEKFNLLDKTYNRNSHFVNNVHKFTHSKPVASKPLRNTVSDEVNSLWTTRTSSERDIFVKPAPVRRRSIAVQMPSPQAASAAFDAHSVRKLSDSFDSHVGCKSSLPLTRKAVTKFNCSGFAEAEGPSRKISVINVNSELLQPRPPSSISSYLGERKEKKRDDSRQLMSPFFETREMSCFTDENIDVLNQSENPLPMSKRLSRSRRKNFHDSSSTASCSTISNRLHDALMDEHLVKNYLSTKDSSGSCYRENINIAKEDDCIAGTVTTVKNGRKEPSESRNLEKSLYDVLVFPASRCSKHGLISSVEKMWVRPPSAVGKDKD